MDLMKNHGPIVHFNLAGQSNVVFNDPDDLKVNSTFEYFRVFFAIVFCYTVACVVILKKTRSVRFSVLVVFLFYGNIQIFEYIIIPCNDVLSI